MRSHFQCASNKLILVRIFVKISAASRKMLIVLVTIFKGPNLPCSFSDLTYVLWSRIWEEPAALLDKYFWVSPGKKVTAVLPGQFSGFQQQFSLSVMPSSGIKFWTVVGKINTSWNPQLAAQSIAGAAADIALLKKKKRRKRKSNLVHSLLPKRGPRWSSLELVKGTIFSILSFLTAYFNFPCQIRSNGISASFKPWSNFTLPFTVPWAR